MTPMLCAGILQVLLLSANADESTPPAPTAATETQTQEADKTAGDSGKTAAKSDSYDEAHQITTETGKPMVVMVGTDWCGPCQSMKKKILPKVRENGLLKKVAFAVVNADRESELAKNLTGGGPIPQLVMFRKTADGWMRRKLVGGQSVESVEEFIKEGLALDEAEKASEETPSKGEGHEGATSEKTTSHTADPVDNDKSA